MRTKALIAAAILTLSLAGYQMALAGPGWHGGGMMGPGSEYCDGSGYGYRGKTLSEEDTKAREAFFDATVEVRKQMAVKQAELQATMSQEKPDAKKAGELAGELFELRSQLREKARESGLKAGFGDCCGPMAGRHHRHGGRGMGGERHHRYCR